MKFPNLDKFDENLIKNIEKNPENFESFQIEYKIKFDGNVNELRRDIVAFANGEVEGYIFFGITDEQKKIIGIEKNEVDGLKTVFNDALPKKIDPVLIPFPTFKVIPLSCSKYIVIIKIDPKKHGIYGIRKGDNPSHPDHLLYEFWKRMDGSKRRLKIEDIEELILKKGGSVKKNLEVNISKTTILPTISKSFVISISAVNKSTRPITITNYGLLSSDQKMELIIFPGNSSGVPFNMRCCDPLPKKLDDGDSCHAFVERQEFEHLIKENGVSLPVKVKAYFNTNDGRFLSNEIEIEKQKK